MFYAFKETRFAGVIIGAAGRYNELVQDWPIITKSVTSGVMYGAGDVICQVGEAKHNGTPVNIEWKRTAIMATFGTVISGPLYHYWFAYLDTVPTEMFKLRKQRQRWRLLRAHNLLKSHNIPVGELILPDTKPFHKWTTKVCKILMDQLIFSTLYMGIFFMGIGIANDVAGVGHRTTSHPPEIAGMIHSLNTMKTDNNVEAINNIIRKLEHSHPAEKSSLMASIHKAWEHTKKVYIPTYIADWIVWPPLQLVNFTFIPLRYQVLYVNVCNLLWNTFLSFMANGGH